MTASLYCGAQRKVKGVVVDSIGIGIRDTWVRNINSKKRVEVTDQLGEFSIRASVGDTLNFHNFYYEESHFVVTNHDDFNISLKKIPGCVLVITDYYSPRKLGLIYGVNYGTIGTFYNTGYLDILLDTDFKLSYGHNFSSNDRLTLTMTNIFRATYYADLHLDFVYDKADFDGNQFFNYEIKFQPILDDSKISIWLPSLVVGHLNFKTVEHSKSFGYGLEKTTRLFPDMYINGSFLKYNKINKWSVGLKYSTRFADISIQYDEMDIFKEYSISLSRSFYF